MNFLDELLLEAETAEEKQRIELDRLRADQLLSAIAVLEAQINDANKLVDDEIKLVEEYRTMELARLNKKISWLAWNEEQFIRSTGEKTIRLPHGMIKLRMSRERVEISDLQRFLNVKSNQRFLKIIPESYQPELQAVHSHIKATGELPVGVNLIPGEVKFSYSTNKRSHDNGKDDERTDKSGIKIERTEKVEAVEGQSLRGE